jgi:hypothetical protein
MLLQWQATITYLAKFGNIQNTEVENSTAAFHVLGSFDYFW